MFSSPHRPHVPSALSSPEPENLHVGGTRVWTRPNTWEPLVRGLEALPAPPFWSTRNPAPARTCPQQVPTPVETQAGWAQGVGHGPHLGEKPPKDDHRTTRQWLLFTGPDPGLAAVPGEGGEGGHDYCFLTDEASFLLGTSDHLMCYFIGVHPLSPPLLE